MERSAIADRPAIDRPRNHEAHRLGERPAAAEGIDRGALVGPDHAQGAVLGFPHRSPFRFARTRLAFARNTRSAVDLAVAAKRNLFRFVAWGTSA